VLILNLTTLYQSFNQEDEPDTVHAVTLMAVASFFKMTRENEKYSKIMLKLSVAKSQNGVLLWYYLAEVSVLLHKLAGLEQLIFSARMHDRDCSALSHSRV
jgi:hypothetical protein